MMKLRSFFPAVTAVAGCAAGYWTGLRHQVDPVAVPAPSGRIAGAPDGESPPRSKSATRAQPDPQTALIERFTGLAGTVSPQAALTEAAALKGRERETALRTLILAWIDKAGIHGMAKDQLIAEAGASEGRPDALVSLASMLRIRELSACRSAWMGAFGDHPLRSGMFSMMAAVEADSSPDRLAEICRDWLPWEKSAFLSESTKIWAAYHPELALGWARGHPGEATAEMVESGVRVMIDRDPGSALKILESSQSPGERLAAASAYGTRLATEDTRRAVEWANTLPEGPERDAAHEAIYQSVPRGVGAVMSPGGDGLPIVRRLVPGGPLARAGFHEGDVLAGVQQPDGSFHGFGGAALADTVQQLRGEPGTGVEVVAMRRDPATGSWQEIRSLVEREQLLFSRNPSGGGSAEPPEAGR